MKNIIFDFDGTIADSYKDIYAIIRELAPDLGHKKVTDEQIEELRNMKTEEMFRKIGIPLIKLPQVILKIKIKLKNRINRIEIIKDMDKTLINLKKRGYFLGILTSNDKEPVEIFLKKFKINIFDSIYAGSSLFGKHVVLKKMLNKLNLDISKSLYIGDETRDIEAAKKIRMTAIAVTWGFGGKKILRKMNPDFIAEKPEDLSDYILNYSR